MLVRLFLFRDLVSKIFEGGSAMIEWFQLGVIAEVIDYRPSEEAGFCVRYGLLFQGNRCRHVGKNRYFPWAVLNHKGKVNKLRAKIWSPDGHG